MAREVCDGFAWIGQSFKYCDDCGHPYWVHNHRRSSKGPFTDDELLVPISSDEAAAVRRKWEHAPEYGKT